MKNCFKFLCSSSILVLSFAFLGSCSESDNLINTPVVQENSSQKNLAEFTLNDLELIASNLEKEGYDVSEMIDSIKADIPESETKLLAALVVNSRKISVDIPHPVDANKTIKISAILLYPNFHRFKSNMKLVVGAPPTYIEQRLSPSKVFGNLWTWQNVGLQAASSISPYLINAGGKPVLLIDYPGFGDSNGQIAHPYLDQKILAESSISLIREAQKVVKSIGIRLSSDELLITGYSQGAFVATSIVREIETNPKNRDLKVKMLSVGGLPANLTKIWDKAIKKGFTDSGYLFPYTLWGYKKNRYPALPVELMMKEPYYTLSSTDFTGNKVNNYPTIMKDIYTADFLANYKTSSKYNEVRRVFAENNIKPWRNSAKFTIYHGTWDTTVDYWQSKEYAAEHNQFGGNVNFKQIYLLGNHGLAFIPYWVATTADLNSN